MKCVNKVLVCNLILIPWLVPRVAGQHLVAHESKAEAEEIPYHTTRYLPSHTTSHPTFLPRLGLELSYSEAVEDSMVTSDPESTTASRLAAVR